MAEQGTEVIKNSTSYTSVVFPQKKKKKKKKKKRRKRKKRKIKKGSGARLMPSVHSLKGINGQQKLRLDSMLRAGVCKHQGSRPACDFAQSD